MFQLSIIIGCYIWAQEDKSEFEEITWNHLYDPWNTDVFICLCGWVGVFFQSTRFFLFMTLEFLDTNYKT